VQREAIELQLRRPGRGDPLSEGLAQLDGYLERLGLDTGTLVIFDRRPDALSRHRKPELAKQLTPGGREVTLLNA
jgi:hypothetical protein